MKIDIECLRAILAWVDEHEGLEPNYSMTAENFRAKSETLDSFPTGVVEFHLKLCKQEHLLEEGSLQGRDEIVFSGLAPAGRRLYATMCDRHRWDKVKKALAKGAELTIPLLLETAAKMFGV